SMRESMYGRRVSSSPRPEAVWLLKSNSAFLRIAELLYSIILTHSPTQNRSALLLEMLQEAGRSDRASVDLVYGVITTPRQPLLLISALLLSKAGGLS